MRNQTVLRAHYEYVRVFQALRRVHGDQRDQIPFFLPFLFSLLIKGDVLQKFLQPFRQGPATAIPIKGSHQILQIANPVLGVLLGLLHPPDLVVVADIRDELCRPVL